MLIALIAVYLVVFAVWPEVNSLAAIGARPDGGGRFYGAGNLTETVLLAVSLEAAALLGGWWIAGVFGLRGHDRLELCRRGRRRDRRPDGRVRRARRAHVRRPLTVKRVVLGGARRGRGRGRPRRPRRGQRRVEPRHARVPARPGVARRGPRAPGAHLGRVGRVGLAWTAVVFAVSIVALVILWHAAAALSRGRCAPRGHRRLAARQRQPAATSPRPARSRTRCSGRTSGYGNRCVIEARSDTVSPRCTGPPRSHVRRASRRASPRASRRCSPGPDRPAPTSPPTSTSGRCSSTTASPSGTTSGTRAATASSPTASCTTRWRRVLGIRLLAVATVATATLAFAVLVLREWGPRGPLVEPDVRGRLGRDRPLGRVPVRARRRARAARALGAPGAAAVALRRRSRR